MTIVEVVCILLVIAILFLTIVLIKILKVLSNTQISCAKGIMKMDSNDEVSNSVCETDVTVYVTGTIDDDKTPVQITREVEQLLSKTIKDIKVRVKIQVRIDK